MQQFKNKGFTIIELLIVLAIIGILASIAVPSYSSYITNARRLDGQIALRNAAQYMERCRTQQFTYVGCDTDDKRPTVSPDGHYSLAYTPTATANAFSITATPATGSPQVNDAKCTSLIITQTGATSATGTAQSECW